MAIVIDETGRMTRSGFAKAIIFQKNKLISYTFSFFTKNFEIAAIPFVFTFFNFSTPRDDCVVAFRFFSPVDEAWVSFATGAGVRASCSSLMALRCAFKKVKLGMRR
jgi:hypothetical protein